MAASARQTVRILGLAAVLLLLWQGISRVLPRPELAETNYVANRLRIERWMQGPTVSNVIVGTSIGGRLLPSYFQGTRLASMANLGLDGGNPETGLALALARPVPPGIVFLEVHRLRVPPGSNDRQLLNLLDGPGLEVSRWVPSTAAEARPSTVLYGWLKRQQKGSEATVNAAGNQKAGAAGPPADPSWTNRIAPKVRALQARGTRVVLLRLPAGVENPAGPESSGEAEDLARQLGLPLVDLYQRSIRDGGPMEYSDGLHLAPASAAKVARWLAEESP